MENREDISPGYIIDHNNHNNRKNLPITPFLSNKIHSKFYLPMKKALLLFSVCKKKRSQGPKSKLAKLQTFLTA